MTDDTNDDLYDLLASLVAQAAKQQNRIEELEAKNVRFKSALEEIAEGIITDASSEYDMWHTARDALKGNDDGD